MWLSKADNATKKSMQSPGPMTSLSPSFPTLYNEKGGLADCWVLLGMAYGPRKCSWGRRGFAWLSKRDPQSTSEVI